MKLFGKELFGHRKITETHLYDFAQFGLLNSHSQSMGFTGLSSFEDSTPVKQKKAKKAEKEVTPPPEITPKELFKLEALNDNEFKIASDPEYIRVHVEDMKDRLKLYKETKKDNRGNDLIWLSGAESYGKQEVESMIERLNNRLRIAEFDDILKEFPHTSSLKVSELVEQHKHLRCGTAGQFVPDFPREATQAMKRYNQMCQQLCGKDTNFYVIANHKDFDQIPKKRDPILLAQSPFGFFWQVLGAWDEEMQYLGDL